MAKTEASIIIGSAKKAIGGILKLPIMAKHKKELIRVMIWKITEAKGKYNTQFRSCKAIKLIDKNNKNKVNKNKYLIHEHVYPIKDLICEILEKPDNYEEILKKAIACVVTKAEHGKLHNKKYEQYTGWERYEKVGIKVFEIKDGKMKPYKLPDAQAIR